MKIKKVIIKGFQDKKSGGHLKTHQNILTLLNQNDTP